MRHRDLAEYVVDEQMCVLDLLLAYGHRVEVGDLVGGCSCLPGHARCDDRRPCARGQLRVSGSAVEAHLDDVTIGVVEVIEFGADVTRKLAEVEDKDEILKALRADLEQAVIAYRSAAFALHNDRSAAADKLAKLAETQINSLAMKVRFEVSLHASENESAWTSAGWDTVEYRIATNPGEPLKPLHEIASGGEMSRVMLALKVSVEEGAAKPRKKSATPRTLVFDEIDIGIGGRAAEAVGQKLKALSRAQQVLCVTHLPQIAAFADQHFLIDKRESDGRTKTGIRLLDDRARMHEVARMLSGAKVTDTSLQHAGQMIAASR